MIFNINIQNINELNLSMKQIIFVSVVHFLFSFIISLIAIQEPLKALFISGAIGVCLIPLDKITDDKTFYGTFFSILGAMIAFIAYGLNQLISYIL